MIAASSSPSALHDQLGAARVPSDPLALLLGTLGAGTPGAAKAPLQAAPTASASSGSKLRPGASPESAPRGPGATCAATLGDVPTCGVPTCGVPTCGVPTCGVPTCDVSIGDASIGDASIGDASILNVSVVNVPFRAECGGLDGSVLDAFFRERDVEAVREYFYVVDGRPHLCCWIEWRARPAPTVADKRRARERRADATELLDAPSRSAFDALRAWRLARARELSVPAYRLFTDRVLARIAKRRPVDRTELGAIEGVGATALENWANGVLDVLNGLSAAGTTGAEPATRPDQGRNTGPDADPGTGPAPALALDASPPAASRAASGAAPGTTQSTV